MLRAAFSHKNDGLAPNWRAGSSEFLNVLVYAPTSDRVASVQDRYPEYADALAFVREMDSQAAKYMLEHCESEWLGAAFTSTIFVSKLRQDSRLAPQ